MAKKPKPPKVWKPIEVECPYCHEWARFVPTSAQLYQSAKDYGPVYLCDNGHEAAWVGCHKGTANPKGRLADKALRMAKMEAHRVFDPMWKRKMQRDGIDQSTAKSAAYGWLGEQMGLSPDQCTIGMFDIAQCARVVAICAPYSSRNR